MWSTNESRWMTSGWMAKFAEITGCPGAEIVAQNVRIAGPTRSDAQHIGPMRGHVTSFGACGRGQCMDWLDWFFALVAPRES